VKRNRRAAERVCSGRGTAALEIRVLDRVGMGVGTYGLDDGKGFAAG